MLKSYTHGQKNFQRLHIYIYIIKYIIFLKELGKLYEVMKKNPQ